MQKIEISKEQKNGIIDHIVEALGKDEFQLEYDEVVDKLVDEVKMNFKLAEDVAEPVVIELLADLLDDDRIGQTADGKLVSVHSSFHCANNSL